MEEDISIAVETGQAGFARVGRDLRVLSRTGRLSAWLPEPGQSCCDTALLFGMEDDLLTLQKQDRKHLTLPGIHVQEMGDGPRANIVMTWDAMHESYLVLTMADYGAGEIEALLTAERRNKQMSDERLLAETERANIQTRINAVAQERARIARDLHDTLVQSMVGLMMQIRLALKLMHSNPELAFKELSATERLAHEGLDSARQALGEIRSRNFEVTTLGTSIRNALSQLRARLNIKVSLIMDPAADDLGGEIALGLARVFEEALRNIERHARARNLEVALRIEGSQDLPVARLNTADDGIGFNKELRPEGHFGLEGMEEQIELLGGTLQIDSLEGKGTKIVAVIPVPEL